MKSEDTFLCFVEFTFTVIPNNSNFIVKCHYC